MTQALALYLAAVNAAAFFLFAADKRRAIRDERRIPERELLTCAALGGVFGAVAAQQIFRHKTRKEPFRSVLWAILAAWAALGLWLLYR
ncbi:DUF1294 domain-containing protein [Phenylobacterium sp.]|uniref:DUF1294 domain-containing protein n=1 Tax=Phenylobacterium sp. TaxID=1871053 RepID=UPI0035ADC2EA